MRKQREKKIKKSRWVTFYCMRNSLVGKREHEERADVHPDLLSDRRAQCYLVVWHHPNSVEEQKIYHLAENREQRQGDDDNPRPTVIESMSLLC